MPCSHHLICTNYTKGTDSLKSRPIRTTMLTFCLSVETEERVPPDACIRSTCRLKFLNWKVQMNGDFDHIDQLDNKDDDTSIAFKISLVSLFFSIKVEPCSRIWTLTTLIFKIPKVKFKQTQ